MIATLFAQQFRLRLGATMLTIALLANGCGQPSPRDSELQTPDNSNVIVICNPLATIAKRLAGDDLTVVLPVPVGEAPSNWQPSDEQLQQFQDARLIIRPGAGYAPWLDLVSLPEDNVIDFSERLPNKLIADSTTSSHRHGPTGESHSSDSFYTATWLDPTLLAAQTELISSELKERWPQLADSFAEREQQLLKELQELDKELLVAAERISPDEVWLAEGELAYLARHFGWEFVDLGWTSDKIPSAEEWRTLKESSSPQSKKIMLWGEEPNSQLKSELADHSIAVIVLNLGDRRENENDDYLQVIEGNIETLIKTQEQLSK